MKKRKKRGSVFMPKEDWKKMKDIADRNNRTLVGQVREWIKNEK